MANRIIQTIKNAYKIARITLAAAILGSIATGTGVISYNIARPTAIYAQENPEKGTRENATTSRTEEPSELEQEVELTIQPEKANERTLEIKTKKEKTQSKPQPQPKPTDYEELIKKYASQRGLDANLIKAQIEQESRFDPNAKSKSGALGLMQLMKGTAKDLGYNHEDMLIPEKAIEAGTRYMQRMYNYFPGTRISEEERTKLALAAFNAGYGNIFTARKMIRKSNQGEKTCEITYHTKKGEKKKKTVNIEYLKGQSEDSLDGVSMALPLVTGENSSRETKTYVARITARQKEYTKYR